MDKLVNFGMENMIMASHLPISRTAPLSGLSVLGQLGPFQCKSDLCHDVNQIFVFQTLVAIEATETKMDHVSVISIKRGSISAPLADFADSPFKMMALFYPFILLCTQHNAYIQYFHF
jgi:hypothetical protein